MSILDDLGDYCLDDEEFAKSAGVTQVSAAWTKVLEYTQGIVNEMIAISKGGTNTKEFYSEMKHLTNAVAKMSNIVMCQSQLVGLQGNNSISQITDSCNEESMSEEEIIKMLDDVITGSTQISLTDVNNYIDANKEKIEQDGGDHGDLNDITW